MILIQIKQKLLIKIKVCDFKKDDYENIGDFPKNKLNFLDQEIIDNINELYSKDYEFINSFK